MKSEMKASRFLESFYATKLARFRRESLDRQSQMIAYCMAHTVWGIQFITTLEREFPRCKSCSTPSAHRKTWLMTISFAENSDQIMPGCAHQRELAYVQMGP